MSMKRHQRTVGKSDTHLTPPEIMAKLGSFALDPACPNYVIRPLASQCLTKQEDGLKTPWRGRVWLNPPFNRYERPKWMAKMAAHGDGIMLVPAATETKAFYDYVWAPPPINASGRTAVARSCSLPTASSTGSPSKTLVSA